MPEPIPEQLARWEARNESFVRRTRGPWTRAAVTNLRRITEVWLAHGSRDVSRLRHEGPAAICASGPSLLDARSALMSFKGRIYAGATNLAWFRQIGVQPTYAVLLDEQPSIVGAIHASRLVMDRDVTILTHPCIHPSVLTMWPTERLYFYLAIAEGLPICHCLDELYGHIAGGPGIETHLSGGGNYVTLAIYLAAMAGCSPIYLVGYDLAYIRGRTRWDREGPPPENAIEKDGVPTDSLMTDYEAITLETLDGIPTVDVRNVWRGGLLQGMASATLEELANA